MKFEKKMLKLLGIIVRANSGISIKKRVQDYH